MIYKLRVYGGGGGLVAKSCLTLVTPWTVAHQSPLSMGFSRQEQWGGLPFPSPVHSCMLRRFSCVRLCVTLWTAAFQAPLSTGFSRQEYWSRLPFPSPHLGLETDKERWTEINLQNFPKEPQRDWFLDTLPKRRTPCMVLRSFQSTFFISLILDNDSLRQAWKYQTSQLVMVNPRLVLRLVLSTLSLVLQMTASETL